MTRYAAGRRLEYFVRDVLTASGHTVARVAGSKGPFDLVAITGRRIRLIQVKKGRARPRDIEKLRAVPVPRNCSREIWERRRAGFYVREL